MNKVYKVFPGGKFKVLTFSYDDGKIEDRRLVKLFNKYNLKATFNLDTGIIDPAIRIPQEEWPELYKGHDIAVHTFTHPTMIRLNDYAALKEILEDKVNLEKIFNRPIYGLAYPNGSYDSRIVDIAKSVGIKYARVTNDKYAATKAAEAYAANSDGPILIGDENGFLCLKTICAGFQPVITIIILLILARSSWHLLKTVSLHDVCLGTQL